MSASVRGVAAVPVRVEVREELPRTSTGKVDRRSVEEDATSRAWSWE